MKNFGFKDCTVTTGPWTCNQSLPVRFTVTTGWNSRRWWQLHNSLLKQPHIHTHAHTQTKAGCIGQCHWVYMGVAGKELWCLVNLPWTNRGLLPDCKWGHRHTCPIRNRITRLLLYTAAWVDIVSTLYLCCSVMTKPSLWYVMNKYPFSYCSYKNMSV